MSLFHKKKDAAWSSQDSSVIPKTLTPEINSPMMSDMQYMPQDAGGVRRLLSYQLANLQGVGARARQEDSFTVANAIDVTAVKEKGLLFVVCDGMGGMKDGKVASETAIASIRNSFLAMDRTGDLAWQLRESVLVAADEVENILGGDGGSTVVACIIFDEKLYFASVGDSFLYLKRGMNLYRLNHEHNLKNYLFRETIRAGSADPTEGKEAEEAAALTQFLGMTGISEVDGFRIPYALQDGDVLLACSDGVGGVLTEREVWDALNLDMAQDMCQMIENNIVAHGVKHQDNYTALIVKCMY